MRRSLSFLAALALVGCTSDGPVDTGDTTGDTTGGVDDTGEVDTAPIDRGAGALNGSVRVQLYEEGEAGLREIPWEGYTDGFPFGAIYVAAYTVDPLTGASVHHDEFVVSAPTTAGDDYTLTVDLDDAEAVYVYAALDWWPDGVIGTGEPIGLHGDPVFVLEGGAVDGVDIVINAPLLPTGGGGGGTYVTLSGNVVIDGSYGGGDGKVMLYDANGNGPSYVTPFTPTPTADGAEATFALGVGSGIGDARLIGAWDDDLNGLIDPTDTWGAYVVEGENANPLTVGTTNSSGLTVMLPFGLPPALSPFVRLEGSLTFTDDFSSLPAGTSVYVAALRTRPEADATVESLARGYDWQRFTGAELAGTSLDYLLVTPSSAETYLWAFGDIDGDGILNESGEPLGAYGPSAGRLSTGTVNQADLDMLLVLNP